MLTNEQKSLLKRAQRQADLPDADYREALQVIAGVSSSTDPRMGDEHLDKLMKYFEAIYWRKVETGDLTHKPGKWEPFLKRDYWKLKNTPQQSSRDRFTGRNLAQQIADLETAMADLGFNAYYCAKIKANVTSRGSTADASWKYKAALERTLASKRKKLEEHAGQPF